MKQIAQPAMLATIRHNVRRRGAVASEHKGARVRCNSPSRQGGEGFQVTRTHWNFGTCLLAVALLSGRALHRFPGKKVDEEREKKESRAGYHNHPLLHDHGSAEMFPLKDFVGGDSPPYLFGDRCQDGTGERPIKELHDRAAP